MASDGLKVGQRLQIKPAYSDGEWYASRVEDLGDTTVTIGTPLKGGALVPISIGTTLDCQFPREDAFYAFQAEVVNRRAFPLPVLILRRPESVTRFQRRKMFRLPAVLPVSFVPVGGGETGKGNTLDISGGGICLSASQPMEPGAELETTVSFPDGSNISARGRVIKVAEVAGERGEKRYVHGIEFLDLPIPVQEKIVAFIFAEQRERRRREVGPW